MNRDDVARTLSYLLKKIDRRIKGERFRSLKNDSEYLQFARVAVQAATALNVILKDGEIADLTRRIEGLEAKQNGRN